MVPIMVRLEDETHAKVKKLAEDNGRSLNNAVNYILDSYFDADALRARLAVLEARHAADNG